MSLDPLCCLVKDAHLFFLFLLLFAHDCFQSLPFLVLLKSLLPLFLEVGESLFLLLEDVELLDPLGVRLLHLAIVGLEGSLILGVGPVELRVHLLFFRCVVLLRSIQLRTQLVLDLLQPFFVLFMLSPSLLLDLASLIFELLIALSALATGLGQLVLKVLEVSGLGLLRLLLRLNSLLEFILLFCDGLLQAFGFLEKSLLLALD